MSVLRITTLLILLFFISACGEQKAEINYQFELLKKEKTGLLFENVVKQNDDFNVFSYMYFFNGGGVATADFNQDGLNDLFFTSNMGANKLFLNEGELKFKDITVPAGLEGEKGWTSGVCVADVNQDGLPDIYVSQLGDYETMKGSNQLYINKGLKDGVPTFENQAAEYGLDLKGFATQALFFDYDLDNDLDFFQLNHSLHQNGTFGKKANFKGTQDPYAGDKLFRNDNGQFVEVTMDAGIESTVIGYGLGVVAGDINFDGWPDLYVSNDFHENDYLYINQKDGTFKNEVTDQLMHTSRFSMGVDMADINNDGWSEILTLDMLPQDPYILKTSLGEDGYDVFHFKLGFGYNHQYARNNLQLNNADNTFSEIGVYSGIFATDWSWAPLFMDFDHDGYKDIFISNGIPRRMNDIDWINFKTADPDIQWKTGNNFVKADELSMVDKMPRIKLKNKFYRNSRDLKFEDLENQIADNTTSFSNGAVYVDLDNDGDLEIVVNNIEDEPYLYKNLTIDQQSQGNYLDVALKGKPGNLDAIGAKLLIYKKNEKLTQENFPVRGYQSHVANGFHIGVGDTLEVDSILLIWPDQTYEQLAPTWNTQMQISWKANLPQFDYNRMTKKTSNTFSFEEITDQYNLRHRHQENPFVEFNREALIPHMASTEGPAVAVGDVNGDGLDDLFLGSSKRKRSALYFQNTEGAFYDVTPQSIIQDSLFEDVDAIFKDIENDGDLDLIIAAGGNEYNRDSEARKQRAYLNDGKGGLVRKDIFPNIFMTASCVLAEDVNQDGFVDFFFGARSVPFKYGLTPESYLMINQGDGTFKESTASYHDQLKEIGLVKDGIWADFDKDGLPDLILAVEWEPIQIFLNKGDHFEYLEVGDWKGWWNFVAPADLDGDGDIDLLAGNTGKNSKLQPTAEEPVRMYVNDFDENGQVEQVLTYYQEGKEIPFANYAELTGRMVTLKKKYLYAKDFAKASLNELFGKEKLSKSIKREINTLQSVWFENTGDGQFLLHELPAQLQWSSLETSLIRDVDEGTLPKFILGGNFYECNIEMGRYDANFGNILSFKKDQQLEVHPLGDLRIKGQIRRIRTITVAGKEVILLVRNNDNLLAIQEN